MNIPFDVEIPILIDNSFSVLKHNFYVRGYQVYMDIRTPIIGDDTLFCKPENSDYDENAVAVLHHKEIEPRIVDMFHSAIRQRSKNYFSSKSQHKSMC